MEQDMGKENEVNYPVEDLTDKSFEEISEILKGEQEAGRLFHGSNASAPYEELRVNKADDIHRESGRKTAVYAADQPEEALHRAVVNRQFFGDNLRSYTIGWSQKEGKFVMTADPSAYTLLMNERDECFSDGYIYILDRNGFEQSPDSSHEFAAEKNQTPIKAYKVPGHVVADAMFQIDNGTIVQYSEEEMQAIELHRAKEKAINDQRRIETFVDTLFDEVDNTTSISSTEAAKRMEESEEFSGTPDQMKILETIRNRDSVTKEELSEILFISDKNDETAQS